MIGSPAAAKNSPISRLSGAAPLTRIRIRPTEAGLQLAEDQLVGEVVAQGEAAGTFLPAWSSATFCRPTLTAQAKILAFAPPARWPW
jgi:hypothetical protein